MTNWKTLPENLPNDLEIVWCRLNYWFGHPFKAFYSVANQTFTDTTNAVTFPAYTISRWRSL
jgi:hypothetical protein